MKRKIIRVQYRRKKEGKTNYYKRLGLLKAGKRRLVIRRSLKNILLQIVEYVPSGDKILVSYNTQLLEKQGWKFNKRNLPAAYLGGLMLGKLAKEKNIKEAILDCGLQTSIKGSRIYAAVKGVIDAGLKVPCSEEVFPDENRLSGKHILDYCNIVKDKEGNQFSSLKKKGLDEISKSFAVIKEKILKGN